MHARITLFDRAYFLRDLSRLVAAVNYNERMKRAGVPDKNRLKILRRFRPWAYYMRKEMSALIADIQWRSW